MDMRDLFSRGKTAKVPEQVGSKTTEDRLQKLLRTAEGKPGSEYIEQMVEELRDGRMQMQVCTDDPEKAAYSAARGDFAKAMFALANGRKPAGAQFSLVYDAGDGQGAGQKADVQGYMLPEIGGEVLACCILGKVTRFHEKLWTRLRGISMTPMEVTMEGGRVEGEVVMHYAWVDSEDVVHQRREVYTVTRQKGGKLEVLNVVKEQPTNTASDLVRACFAINQNAGKTHQTWRQRGA